MSTYDAAQPNAELLESREQLRENRRAVTAVLL
jgi:hypothetical protein